MTPKEKLCSEVMENQPPLTDMELAAKAGVALNTVKAAQRGKVSLDSLIAIGRAMGCQLVSIRPRKPGK